MFISVYIKNKGKLKKYDLLKFKKEYCKDFVVMNV